MLSLLELAVPTAMTGRVLVHPTEDRDSSNPHADG